MSSPPPKKLKTVKQKLVVNTHFHPILPDDLIDPVPLVDVYIDTVTDAKNISKVITTLNATLPIPSLIHLKRIRGREVLLLPVQDLNPSKVHSILSDKGFDTSLLRNNVSVASVARVPPKTRAQHGKAQEHWPCNFHADKYREKLCTNTLFGQTEIDQHLQFMRTAISVAKICGKRIGAVVVDPAINSVIAVGYDRTDNNPCKHAVMIAVDNVARTQNGGAWTDEGSTCSGIPQMVLDHLVQTHSGIRFGMEINSAESSNDGPYLCTGYYVYVTREPCIMCAMALIHSRAKRVFYGARTDNGALGSVCKIHTVKDLNHHYEVFAGLLENECRQLQ